MMMEAVYTQTVQQIPLVIALTDALIQPPVITIPLQQKMTELVFMMMFAEFVAETDQAVKLQLQILKLMGVWTQQPVTMIPQLPKTMEVVLNLINAEFAVETMIA